jgi:hypothetical protein
MERLGKVFGFLGPVLVIGSLVAFVGYALFLHNPADTSLACGNSFARQADIAVHVIRQWAGKEGEAYTSCVH